jgi:hypothetical protein
MIHTVYLPVRGTKKEEILKTMRQMAESTPSRQQMKHRDDVDN